MKRKIRDLIEIYLSNEGYETIKATNGVEALEGRGEKPCGF